MAVNPVDQYVGQRLKRRRTILGISQESLGNAIGVTFQQIQKYERGANRIGAGRLFDFSRFLKVPIEYFYESYQDKNTDSNISTGFAEDSDEFEHERLVSRETLEMVRSYYRIEDPQIRKKISDLIRSLSSVTQTKEKIITPNIKIPKTLQEPSKDNFIYDNEIKI